MPDGEKLPCQGQTGRGEGCGPKMCDLSGPQWAPGCRPLGGGQGVWRDLGLFQQSLPIRWPRLCFQGIAHSRGVGRRGRRCGRGRVYGKVGDMKG